jgi:hypothetical protein
MIDKYIIHGNFTEDHSESLLGITDMQIEDIEFGLMFVYLDYQRHILINELLSLPEKEWVVCGTVVNPESGVLLLKLGIPNTNERIIGLENNFSSFYNSTGAPIFHGKLPELLNNRLFIKKSEEDIEGIAYISRVLLIQKLRNLIL